MKRTQQQIKEKLTITCFYQKDEADVREIIKQAFLIFVKQELAKPCV